MLERLPSILMILACFILWIIVTFLIMLSIKYNASKRSKIKVSDEYPYFKYPIFKKIFFVGLKGKVPFALVILSSIINILLIVMIVVFLCNIISMSIIASYCLKMGGLVFLILNLIRLFIVYNTNIKL